MIWRCAKHISMGVVAFAALFAVLIGLPLYTNKGRCIAMPGGYTLGYASIVNPDPKELPAHVLRDPSGKVLIKTAGFVELERDPEDPTRFYIRYFDVSVNFPGEKLMPYILTWNGWQWDEERPSATRRMKKWTEPLPKPPHDLRIMAIGLALIYDPLLQSEEFDVEYCGTPWFDQGE
ncbi:MAG: hypothetical protein QNJ62_08180 [Methyloceanibacter sp.]|nr:hypothetical protein [Methyloceanibacter sp.]